MFQGLLLLAAALRTVDDAIGSTAFFRRDKRYFPSTVTSEVVLTTEELEAWGDPNTEVEKRVAIFKRGLLRYTQMQSVTRRRHEGDGDRPA